MKVQLIKSIHIGSKKIPVGTSMEVTPHKGKELIDNGQANEYKGQFPPKISRNTKLKIKLEELKK